MQFKAVTWNIKSGHYQDESSINPVGTANLLKIADSIADIQPDVVCFQEIEVDTIRSNRVDQCQVICDLLTKTTGRRWYQLFLAARQMNPGYFGNAIISPHPLQMRMELPLPKRSGRETRCCLLVCITKGNTTLQIATFHLGPKDEAFQAALIKDWLNNSPFPHQRLLIGGDLNCEIDSTAYKTMRDYGLVLNDAGPSGYTFRCYDLSHPARLDYWFYSPDIIIDQQRCEILPIDISDHRPLLCTVIIDD